MFPWLWTWAPQLHFPWSGNVAQSIEPITSLFFKGIPASSGDAQIEEKAFAIASYGKQLGLITEVLINLAEQVGTKSEHATVSLERLKLIKQEIEKIKVTERTNRVAELAAAVVELRKQGGTEYKELSQTLLPLLNAPSV